jgi:hypothetical protein
VISVKKKKNSSTALDLTVIVIIGVLKIKAILLAGLKI